MSTYAIAVGGLSAFTSRESEGRRQLRHDDGRSASCSNTVTDSTQN